MKKICVVGSINMDLVVTVDHFPQPGETLFGKEFRTFPGGKGANQAIAAGRLQADVRMVGKVGDDIYGEQLILNLQKNRVNPEGVFVDPDVSTGVAVIKVDGAGENQIVVVSGANGKLDSRFIDQQFAAMLEYDIFLFQLEIPLETVVYAIKKLKRHCKTIILDPAPACRLPDEIFGCLDYITPNEMEMAMITGKRIKTADDAKEAGDWLRRKGVGTVIIKMGKNGAYLSSDQECSLIPGFTVNAVDTTGAGDSFNAGFGVSLAHGNNLRESVRFANAVGALSTTAEGAQSAMPNWDQVMAFIKTH